MSCGHGDCWEDHETFCRSCCRVYCCTHSDAKDHHCESQRHLQPSRQRWTDLADKCASLEAVWQHNAPISAAEWLLPFEADDNHSEDYSIMDSEDLAWRVQQEEDASIEERTMPSLTPTSAPVEETASQVEPPTPLPFDTHSPATENYSGSQLPTGPLTPPQQPLQERTDPTLTSPTSPVRSTASQAEPPTPLPFDTHSPGTENNNSSQSPTTPPQQPQQHYKESATRHRKKSTCKIKMFKVNCSTQPH